MKEKLELPKLEKNDYLTKGYDFWKEYRLILTELLKRNEEMPKLEKTPENIVKIANESGVKACARYFDISPSQVRYYKNNASNKSRKSINDNN